MAKSISRNPKKTGDADASLPYRRWLLAAMAALLVARPLISSEAVAWHGDGAPFGLLWLLVGLFTSLAAMRAGGWPRSWGFIDFGLLLFVAMWAAAAWYGSAAGNPRAAINMLWEMVALGVQFWLLRQLCETDPECRSMLAVMVTLAVALAGLGLYQVHVTMPADRAEFARDPETMLQRAGEWYAPGSAERQAFEQRMNSTEPLATFALTNSLAGFLALWLFVGLMAAISWPKQPTGPSSPLVSRSRIMRWHWPLLIGMLMLITWCLLLTKSRSAYVAVVMGGVMFAGYHAWVGVRYLSRRALFSLTTVCMLAALLLGLAVAVGGIDKYVLTEAGKSLRFRWEYWQATWQMIEDHPLWGVGPGNFQDYYTRYKLPQASEEIRDPHNWILELLATAGWPATLVGVSIIGMALFRLMRGVRHGNSCGDKSLTSEESGHSPQRQSIALAIGGAAGWLLAELIGVLVGLPLGFDRLLLGMALAIAAWFVLQPWVRLGVSSTHLIAVAAMVMLIHLLAAGGILYPALAGSLWLLLAIGLNQCEPDPLPTKKIWTWVSTGVFAALCGLQYFSTYAPVLRSQGEMLAGHLAPTVEARQQAYERAAIADPWSAEPWQALAELYLREWLANGGPRNLRQFRESADQFLSRQPNSASAFRTAGNWWRKATNRPENAGAAEYAVELLRRAACLYPHSPVLHADLAKALAEAEKPAAAQAAARRALELNALTPHADKRLSEKTQSRMQQLANHNDTPES